MAVFENLPGRILLTKIRDGEFERLLGSYRRLREQGIRAGLDRLSSYRVSIRERLDNDVLTELAVDRTRILRGSGHAGLKPPYEGLYKKGTEFEDSVLGVKRFYRKAGLIQDETISESADYLCVELDFMRQLCLREESLRLREGEAVKTIGKTIAKTVSLEEEFLRIHLGNWVREFCRVVEKHALTDFYRGLALILDAHIRMERKWLESLVRHSRCRHGVEDCSSATAQCQHFRLI